MVIKRILVATDGSATAQDAVAWAADLAAPLGAEVVLVSVIDFANLGLSAGFGFPILEETQMRVLLNQELNGAWSERMREAQVNFRTLVREGNPAPAIVQTAADEGADLIVMGSRGRSGLSELLVGSVAHHVTHHAPTPVVIVPPSATSRATQALAKSVRLEMRPSGPVAAARLQRSRRVRLSVVILPAQPHVRRFERTERHVSNHERWRHPAGWTGKCSFIPPRR
jgi:nucleotide-binding universal stress UspA family protein